MMHQRSTCGNSKLAEVTGFEHAVEGVLERIRGELYRVLRAQNAESRTSSDPSCDDETNYVASMEESIKTMMTFNTQMLALTRAMHDENSKQAHLEEEILRTATTFVGWLVSRARRRPALNI